MSDSPVNPERMRAILGNLDTLVVNTVITGPRLDSSQQSRLETDLHSAHQLKTEMKCETLQHLHKISIRLCRAVVNIFAGEDSDKDKLEWTNQDWHDLRIIHNYANALEDSISKLTSRHTDQDPFSHLSYVAQEERRQQILANTKSIRHEICQTIRPLINPTSESLRISLPSASTSEPTGQSWLELIESEKDDITTINDLHFNTASAASPMNNSVNTSSKTPSRASKCPVVIPATPVKVQSSKSLLDCQSSARRRLWDAITVESPKSQPNPQPVQKTTPRPKKSAKSKSKAAQTAASPKVVQVKSEKASHQASPGKQK